MGILPPHACVEVKYPWDKVGLRVSEITLSGPNRELCHFFLANVRRFYS